MASRQADEIAENLCQLWLEHGSWYQIFTDQGAELRGKLLSCLSRKFGVTQACTLSYMPRQNLIERMHRGLGSLLARTLQHQSNWPFLLKVVESGINNSVHRSTSFAPNFIFYGRQIPDVTQQLLAPTNEEEGNEGQYLNRMFDRMKKVYTDTLISLKRSAEKNESRYNSALKKPLVFQKDQKILLFSPRVKIRDSKKLNQYWKTEATVLEKLNSVLYRVLPNNSKKPMLCHVDRLKPWLEKFKPDREN
jgi:hypothetical protein